jgi:hypothetical protein
MPISVNVLTDFALRVEKGDYDEAFRNLVVCLAAFNTRLAELESQLEDGQMAKMALWSIARLEDVTVEQIQKVARDTLKGMR